LWHPSRKHTIRVKLREREREREKRERKKDEEEVVEIEGFIKERKKFECGKI
jgi:hypothetical protein